MEIALLFILILCNGLFAMAEIALVTARKSRLQRLADDGDSSAAVAIRLGKEPTQFLSTIQIGITAIGILNGIIGEAVLAEPLSLLLMQLGVPTGPSFLTATAIVVIGITYLTIVIGELIPKRIAQFNAEDVARRLARLILFLAHLSKPFVWLLSASTDGFLRLMGKSEFSSNNLTEEDIHAVLAEGSQTGVIEQQEHQMVQNVFRLDDRQIISLMTPRSETVCLDPDLPLEQSIKSLMDSNHSRFPVCHERLQEIEGVVTAKTLLKLHLAGDLAHIRDFLQPAVYVPKSMTGIKLLEEFRESGVQLVFVVDEYGETLGIITLQDVLEALAGEFKPRDPEDLWAIQRNDGAWLLDGLIPIPELKDRLGLKTVPEEDKGKYNTLSGMMMWLMARLPDAGDVTDWEGWRLEVVGLESNHIDKVLATRLADTVTPGTTDVDTKAGEQG